MEILPCPFQAALMTGPEQGGFNFGAGCAGQKHAGQALPAVISSCFPEDAHGRIFAAQMRDFTVDEDGPSVPCEVRHAVIDVILH